MKILKTESPYLDKPQLKKIFLATTIITMVLYTVAMICSLCGLDYFILNYSNAHLDKVEETLRNANLMILLINLVLTLEFYIVLCFILNKRASLWYVLIFYAPPMLIEYLVCDIPSVVYTLYGSLIWFIAPIIENKKFKWSNVLRLVIAVGVVFILQIIIFAIKSGTFSLENHVMSFATHFVYSIEYDIALSITLFTIKLFLDREKGDSEQWQEKIHHTHGSFSQISTKLSQKQSPKPLTKTQKNKLRLVYAKFYIIQLLGFLLIMILPFLLGKVFEFLVMYTAFAIVRYLLGFKYSLHYKKEYICITVGIIVFGILTLAVPFFYITMILAVTLGVGLAILLHLSYKYKSFYLFNKISKPDKFALLYVFFDGDLTEHHVKKICCYKGLDVNETNYIWDYVQGNKLSYMAWKYNYSLRMIINKLDQAIEKITAE